MKTSLIAGVIGLLLMRSLQAQEGSYLEIPLKGRLGEEITASGVEKALKGAKAAGIKHIVFSVDSSGGDQMVCKDLVNLLRSTDKDFVFTAVVQEALGTAVVFIVRADKIFVRPGAKVGGVYLNTAKTEQETGVGSDVILSNIALNAGVQAKMHGRPAELIRAMIDPSEPVFAWKDAGGKAEFGRSLPPGTAKENVLLEHKAGKVLTLTDAEAVALGFAQKFEGTVAELGKALGIEGWVSKGNALATLTEAAAAEKTAQDGQKSDRQKFLIDQNRKRREETKVAIERCLEVAHEWNPKMATYSTQQEWSGYWGGSTDSNRLTPEARRKWQDRTSITISYLSKARGGVAEMVKLEKEAKTLGQELLYPEGKLQNIYEDLSLTMAMLEREYEKRFVDDRK
jgi:hypothetical protein